MRVTEGVARVMRKYQPIFLMTHFNHPHELTQQAAQALGTLVDHGIPTFNQMVLLNGINNHAALVQALARRLIYLRVKPYYMFQCDPSKGTDHLRTSLRDSQNIQRELWGHLSGLAMPNLSLDIPGGGGKVAIVPDFLFKSTDEFTAYVGWDGIHGVYQNPAERISLPPDVSEFLDEWNSLKSSKRQSQQTGRTNSPELP